jgi:unsaturated rhamnogalacturonyl hydrolase
MTVASPELTASCELVLAALLAMQRRSWEQGLAGQAMLALERFDVLEVVVADAVANQTADGRLADLGDENVVNGAAALGPVLAMATRTGDSGLTAAAQRQVDWLLDAAPRADDGTLMHVLDRREVWSDTVYMAVPALVEAGRTDRAMQQLSGHRRRLQRPDTRLFAHIWDEDAGQLKRAAAWGGGNGWVAAGCARALHLLGLNATSTATDEQFATAAARVATEVIDACLLHRTDAGLFHDIVDDPTTFEEVTLAAMLAYSALTGTADGWLARSYADVGGSMLEAVAGHVGPDGLLRPASGSPTFDRPGISAEAQAWFLLAAAAAGGHSRSNSSSGLNSSA